MAHPSLADSIPTSLTLVQRVRQQDMTAWGTFVKLYGPLLYHWARRAGAQDADAADIVQDVVLTITKRIDTFRRDADGQSLRAWMRTITKNKCIDLHRARQRQATAAGGSDARHALAAIVDSGELSEEQLSEEQIGVERTQVVHRAVTLLQAEFERQTWEAFVQTAMHGREAGDVAADLGMSVGSVYTAKSRVLKRLKTEFAGLL